MDLLVVFLRGKRDYVIRGEDSNPTIGRTRGHHAGVFIAAHRNPVLCSFWKLGELNFLAPFGGGRGHETSEQE